MRTTITPLLRRTTLLPLTTTTLALICGGRVQAQSFNIDFGLSAGVPSSNLEAVSQAGHWNAIDLPAIPSSPLDLDGQPTSVQLTTVPAEAEISVPGLSGDDNYLMFDGINTDAGVEVRFAGLENGDYRIITFGFSMDFPSLFSHIDVPGSNEPPQLVGGMLFTGTWILGGHYAEHTMEVTGGALTIKIQGGTCNGVQLTRLDLLGTNYCTAAANSVSVQGSTISASGSASLADTDLTLRADGAPSGQPGLFLFGDQQIQVPFGDGFRCVGGQVVRLPVRVSIQGRFEYDVDFGVYGAHLAAMGTANFQCWYRDPAAGGSTFNLSNGLELALLP